MKVLFTSVSSMNLEPIVTGLESNLSDMEMLLWKFDKGKEEQHHYEGEVDHVILEAFNSYKPNIVIYSGPAEGKCRPFTSTFLEMKQTAKLINLCCDGACPNWHPLLEKYKAEGCFDLTLNIDGNSEWPKGPKDLTLWGPIDPRFYQHEKEKTIQLGFAGGCGAGERKEITDRLKQSVGLVIPERSESWGTYQKYADFMLSCKSVVNFGKTGSGKAHHLKYRIIEAALAKCAVFEEVNPITRTFLDPGVHYFEYENANHLETLIRTKTDDDLMEVAESLHSRITKYYSCEKFWKKVFEKLEGPDTAYPGLPSTKE